MGHSSREILDQFPETCTVERLRQVATRDGVPLVQSHDDWTHGVPKVVGIVEEARPEDIEVADGPERSSEPAQAVDQGVRPGTIDQGAKDPELGSEATSRLPHLVDADRIAVLNGRLVDEQTAEAVRERETEPDACGLVRGGARGGVLEDGRGITASGIVGGGNAV
jgi:hypothetical protein